MNEASSCHALLDRADQSAALGDHAAAVSFYRAALQSIRSSPSVGAATAERLRNAEAFIRERTAEFNDKLAQLVEPLERRQYRAATRFSHSVEMLRGNREVYPQQPTIFYYPYLAQRQFFERDEFGWVPELEAATSVIREELKALLQEGADFRPYVEDEPDRPARQFHHLNNDESWTAAYLWRNAEPVRDIAERCPRTMEALAKVPLTNIGRRTPSALFSRLEPGAHIPPHTGMLNCRLICHLPLIVPSGGALRVGNETREWQEGKLLIFDDSIEHEARNPSSEIRIVLLFDIWRPELTRAEREGISAIFKALDEFQSIPEL